MAAIHDSIGRACDRAGRSRDSVTLIAASKTVDAGHLAAYLRAGLAHVGENYVQEGLAKQAALHSGEGINFAGVHWHFIGALQSNKAREAVAHFELIHTVDRISLARELNKEAARSNRVQDILLQVNLGAEVSKAGVSPAALAELLEQCRNLGNLRIRGLMSLPPYEPDSEAMRPYHSQLRQLLLEMREQCSLDSSQFQVLSMGMSNDFEVAIEEGATHVRVGTALFGARR